VRRRTFTFIAYSESPPFISLTIAFAMFTLVCHSEFSRQPADADGCANDMAVKCAVSKALFLFFSYALRKLCE
jgi:hypothetical protein